MLEEKLVPSFQQIPYTELVKRIDEGSNGILELNSMLHERKDLHEKMILFELKMSKANIFQHEIPTSTSERMLGFFKNFFIFVSRSHIKTHKEFNDSVLKELDDVKSMRTTTVNRTKQLVNNGLKDIQHAEETLEKAKKAFNKAKADYERSVEKLKSLERAVIEHHRAVEEKKRETITKDPSKFSMGRMFQSAFEAHPEQDRDKQIKKVERRNDEMINAANAIIERKRQLLHCMDSLDRYLQEAAAVFQELELDRMRRLKSMMRRFCETERALLKAKEEQLTLLEESISYQEPEEDMLLYITQEKLTEATHKYSGAVKLLDEYLFRKREGDAWSFTTCDEYKIADHASLIAGLVESVDAGSPIAGGNTMAESNLLQRLAEYDTASSANIPESGMTVEDILAEEKRNLQQQQQMAELTKKPSTFASLVDALDTIFCVSPLNITQAGEIAANTTASAVEATSQNLTFERWGMLLQTEEARDHFLKVLDDKRGVSACLDEEGYSALAVAMQSLLSHCEEYDDTKSAMRVLNMANTFYRAVPITPDQEEAHQQAVQEQQEQRDVLAIPHSSMHVVDPAKRYLQADGRLKKHPIWRKQNFWENALKEGVFVEMEKIQPTPWDELSPEGLKETVINIHNLVFGQLGTLSLTMREQSGLEKREVGSHVLVMSRKFQLCEDQEYELLHSITGQPIKEYQPPPIIPNAPISHHDITDLDPPGPLSSSSSGGRQSILVDNETWNNNDITNPTVSGTVSGSGSNNRQGHSSHHNHHIQRHSVSSSGSSSVSNEHHRPVVVEGTATVVGATRGAAQPVSATGRTIAAGDAPVVVNATVVASSSSSEQHKATPTTATGTQPRMSQTSSNPFSFMMNGLSGDSSGKRSRTTSSNSHDDFYATL